jgi:hypothetical protein
VVAGGAFNSGEVAAAVATTVNSTVSRVPFQLTLANLTYLTDYTVTCCTHETDLTSSFDFGATKKFSGIVGDPHVLAADGSVTDFFGQASSSYNIYTSSAMTVVGRLEAASLGSQTLFHADAMERGTLVTEVQVEAGDSSLRVGLHSGGLLSVATPGLATRFFTVAEDAAFYLGDRLEVAWTRVAQTKAFDWGSHAYSQQLKLTSAATDESVSVFVAESQGHRFLDVHSLAGHDAPAATGLATLDSAAPAQLTPGASRSHELFPLLFFSGSHPARPLAGAHVVSSLTAVSAN